MPNATLKEKLEAVKELVTECLVALEAPAKRPTRTSAAPAQKTVATEDIALQIVNKIGDCDENEAVSSPIR